MTTGRAVGRGLKGSPAWTQPVRSVTVTPIYDHAGDTTTCTVEAEPPFPKGIWDVEVTFDDKIIGFRVDNSHPEYLPFTFANLDGHHYTIRFSDPDDRWWT